MVYMYQKKKKKKKKEHLPMLMNIRKLQYLLIFSPSQFLFYFFFPIVNLGET